MMTYANEKKQYFTQLSNGPGQVVELSFTGPGEEY